MLRQGESPVNSPLGWLLFQDTHRIAVTADKSRTSPTSVDCHNMSDIQEIRATPRTSADRRRSCVSEITALPWGTATPHRPPVIDTSSVTLLVQDSGEDRGEAGDDGVGVAGQPATRLKTRNDPVRATQCT